MSHSQESLQDRYAATLARTERLPRAQLKAYQDGLLTKLLEFVFQNSPFYSERLKPIFRKDGRVDLDAWKDVPLLRRPDLENHINRINATNVPDEVGVVSAIRTSGSTGRPMTFRTCGFAQIAALCMMHRMYRWHDLDLSAPMASIRFYSSGTRNFPDGVTEAGWSYIGPQVPHYTLDFRHRPDEMIEWLVRRAPRYLLTFPSIAHDLIAHSAVQRLAGLSLQKIIGISEIVLDYTRNRVRDKLGCEIAQIYACSEMGCIAVQSPTGDQCLICEESVLVEILDDADRPVAPGETGRVVLTSLYNYATPFIRYEIGDRATLAEVTSQSGMTLRGLQRVDGRRHNSLTDAHDRLISPHEMPVSEIASLLGSDQFQIRQTGRTTVELNYVMCSQHEPNTDRIALLLQHVLKAKVAITLTCVDEIPRSAGGKRDVVTSEID